jgi:hypothetical protein
MFGMIRAGAIGTAALVLGALSATAQSMADPAPLLNGDTSAKVIYTTSGVFDSADTATIVTCTSTQKTGGPDVIFGVEFFDNGSLANDVTVGDGVETLSPGGDTDIISTRSVTNITEVPLAVAPGIFGNGAARVLANSTAIICSAHIVDVVTGDYQTSLPIFKKTKQAGD